MFFSEEKNQKTLVFLLFPDPGHGRNLAASARNESLFASFSSEKEGLP
jgi:hypothetical protein